MATLQGDQKGNAKFHAEVSMRYLAALAGTLLLASPASAATMICMSLDQMASVLATERGERPIAEGHDFGDRPMMLYMSDKGTWTLIGLPAVGQACVLASGRALPLPGTPS